MLKAGVGRRGLGGQRLPRARPGPGAEPEPDCAVTGPPPPSPPSAGEAGPLGALRWWHVPGASPPPGSQSQSVRPLTPGLAPHLACHLIAKTGPGGNSAVRPGAGGAGRTSSALDGALEKEGGSRQALGVLPRALRPPAPALPPKASGCSGFPSVTPPPAGLRGLDLILGTRRAQGSGRPWGRRPDGGGGALRARTGEV